MFDDVSTDCDHCQDCGAPIESDSAALFDDAGNAYCGPDCLRDSQAAAWDSDAYAPTFAADAWDV